jgi:hypothetical protein
MKKTLATILFSVFLLQIVLSQGTVPTEEDLYAFFKTKTLVVLEDNPLMEYNIVIKNVMEQEWNVTEYEFISWKEFEEKRFDPQYSFIYTTSVTFANDNTDAVYKFLHLSLGGDYFRMNQMPDLASVPVSFASVEEEFYIYKLAILVRFMQNHIQTLKADPKIISANVFKHYNDNMGDIKTKTLYMLKSELEPKVNSLARIKKTYPYKVKLVEREDIEAAIKNREDDVVFLHKVGPEGTKLNARCYKIIIGAADANFYYFDYHKVSKKAPDGFLESDFKKMAKD